MWVSLAHPNLASSSAPLRGFKFGNRPPPPVILHPPRKRAPFHRTTQQPPQPLVWPAARARAAEHGRGSLPAPEPPRDRGANAIFAAEAYNGEYEQNIFTHFFLAPSPLHTCSHICKRKDCLLSI